MTKNFVKVVLFVSVVAGLLLFWQGYRDIGIGVVIAGYVFYIVLRLIPKRKKEPARDIVQETTGETPEKPDSWESMREKAIEALNRKLRGQKISVDAFFTPSHSKFAALARVREDLCGDAQEISLKADFEILKLRREAQETERLLDEISAKATSEEALRQEIERLRVKAQP